jgi:hypothetical protein
MKRVYETNRLWYRRTFTVPRGWRDERILLHFGAVDWETTVWVNGRELGSHRGGYDGFSFDLTEALKLSGEQEIVVAVFDPSDAGFQPRGKQVRRPNGIWYTPTSGIWQTVWLEPVAAAHIGGLKIVPNVDAGQVEIEVSSNTQLSTNFPGSVTNVQVRTLTGGPGTQVMLGNTQFATEVQVEVRDGARRVARGDASAALTLKQQATISTLRVPLPNAKLWSPDSPHLYTLKITLLNGRERLDEITSYFGMRKISVAKDAEGILRLCLNNEPRFQYGPLDQGFWPDGLYTAPTDEALRYDIEMTKKLGFNMARKHVKVEPARWYYWCDKLGLLVWQDMPSGSFGDNRTDRRRSDEASANYENELRRMIAGLYNHPSIVMWVPFNEGWGQHETARYAELVKQLDPTRLVNEASGWTDRGSGDVKDVHKYPGPEAPNLEEKRATVLGEFGGLGMPVRGHTWQSERNWGYRSFTNATDLTAAYVGLLGKLHPLRGSPGLNAAVYTQTTDVEIEVNGLMTYDRAMVKLDEIAITAAARKLFTTPPKAPVKHIVVPTSASEVQTWRYTTSRPDEGWFQPGFSDQGWTEGPGGFGTRNTPGAQVRTVWSTSDIWLRRTFNVTLPAAGELRFSMHHDEDAEVYVNGVLAARLTGFTTDYEDVPLSAEARAALKPQGNVLAVHCRQTAGGQYIDVGLISLTPAR